jgi:hypothetical protein
MDRAGKPVSVAIAAASAMAGSAGPPLNAAPFKSYRRYPGSSRSALLGASPATASSAIRRATDSEKSRFNGTLP